LKKLEFPKRLKRDLFFNSMSLTIQWYYVDRNGATVGPVSEDVLVASYASGKLNDDSYVWNGTTVNEWLAVSQVPLLMSKLKPKSKPKPVVKKPKSVATKPKQAAKARANPFGGGGGGADAERNNLLAAIRAGKTLKKKPKAVQKKKPVAQMTLAEQMKMKLEQRQAGPKRGAKKNVKKSPAKKPIQSGKKFQSKPAKTYGSKASGGGGGNMPYKLKNKLGNIRNALDKLSPADEWKILAIEKILS